MTMVNARTASPAFGRLRFVLRSITSPQNPKNQAPSVTSLVRQNYVRQCDANEGLKDRFFDAAEVDEGWPLGAARQGRHQTRQCGWVQKISVVSNC